MGWFSHRNRVATFLQVKSAHVGTEQMLGKTVRPASLSDGVSSVGVPHEVPFTTQPPQLTCAGIRASPPSRSRVGKERACASLALDIHEHCQTKLKWTRYY